MNVLIFLLVELQLLLDWKENQRNSFHSHYDVLYLLLGWTDGKFPVLLNCGALLMTRSGLGSRIISDVLSNTPKEWSLKLNEWVIISSFVLTQIYSHLSIHIYHKIRLLQNPKYAACKKNGDMHFAKIV